MRNGGVFSPRSTAHVNSADYSYAYDAIGNRTAAVENGTSTAYTSNRLNQYTAEVFPAHAYDQPLRWSSEYHDVELDLIYYNYRHYNPAMGRWIGRDPLPEVTVNIYNFVSNIPSRHTDELGMQISLCFSYDLGNMIGIDTGKNGKTRGREFKTADHAIWSGNGEHTNNSCCQHLPNEGPIPVGKYKIESLRTVRGWTPLGDWEWYPLSPYLNNHAYSSLNVPIPGTNEYVMRSGFYIHAGNRSDGCVSFRSDVPCGGEHAEDPDNYPHSDEYDKLKAFIKNSKSSAGVRFLYVREHYSECSAIINKIKNSATN